MPRTTIRTEDITDREVSAAKIVEASIGAFELQSDSVGTAELANDVVISTSGAITTTGAFTSVGIDDNADATAVTITSAERVGINKTDPGTAYLYVKDPTTGAGSISPQGGMQVTIEGGTDAGINIFGGSNSSGRLIFGCQDTDFGGSLRYNQNDDTFQIYVNATSNDQSGKDALKIQSNLGSLMKQMCTYQAANLSDDTAVTWTPPRPEGVLITFSISTDFGYIAWSTKSSGSEMYIMMNNSGRHNVASSGQVLTGTTGNNGSLNFSAVTGGNLYMENRLGGGTTIGYVLLG